MSFETWAPPATPATFSDGTELKPVFLSYMQDTTDADGNTILGATSILALLNKVPSFPTGAVIAEQTATNDSANALTINYGTETRRYLNIIQPGGNVLGVGYLQEQMYGPNPVNNGGIGNPGAFSCTPPSGSPTSPTWGPTPVVVIPAASAPITIPAGWTYQEIGPGVFGFGPPPTAPASGSATPGLTAAQVAELMADLPRLEALCTLFGK